MKVCALSPWKTASANDILSFLGRSSADLVVLPGVSTNTPSPWDVTGIIRSGVSVFAEYGKTKEAAVPYFVTHGSEPAAMPRQLFAQSPSAKCLDALADIWRERTFPIGSRTVTFAICGEINAFNPDGSVKHGRQLPFDLLANPTHTVMGRWQHLGRKLSALSRNNKVVIHVANNNRNHEGLTTDVRIYVNEHIQDAKSVHYAGNLKWCECEI